MRVIFIYAQENGFVSNLYADIIQFKSFEPSF